VPDTVTLVTIALTLVAALFAILAFRTAGAGKSQVPELLGRLIRDEADGLRHSLEKHAQGSSARIDQLIAKLEIAVSKIDENVTAMAVQLNADIARVSTVAAESNDKLRHAIEAKLDDASAQQNRTSADFRESMGGNFEAFRNEINDVLRHLSAHQNERFEATNAAWASLKERYELEQNVLRETIEGRLDRLSSDNAASFEHMRGVIDETLGVTLENSIGSFLNRLSEHLDGGSLPDIVILGVGHSGTSLLARMLFTLGWDRNDAEDVFFESVGLREINDHYRAPTPHDSEKRKVILDRALTYLNGLHSPFALKDPRLVFTLPMWIEAFQLSGRRPFLLRIERDRVALEQSYRDRGEMTGREAGMYGRTLDQLLLDTSSHYGIWPFNKMTLRYENVVAAAALVKDVRRMRPEGGVWLENDGSSARVLS
jgi:hypothetical protein